MTNHVLSTAIREGAKRRPQATASFFGEHNTSCALGAALDYLVVEPTFSTTHSGIEVYKVIEEHLGSGMFQFLSDESGFALLSRSHDTFMAPDGETFREIFNAIMYMNDAMKMTREQIADWVEQQENQQTDTSSNI